MWLDSLFKKEKESTPLLSDLSALQVDMHSHLIAGIDDGAQNEEDSLKLLQHLADLGYRKFITTPHVMVDYFKNTVEGIRAGQEKLQKLAIRENINLEIEASAEYYLDEGFDSLLQNNKLLPFGDNYILFEISYINAPSHLNSAIFNILNKGYKPILAHPERYPYWAGNWDKWQELKDMGLHFQVNLASFSGYYGKGARQLAHDFVEKGMIEFLGTDMHNTRHYEAISKSLASADLHKLINSGRILNSTL